MGFFSRFKLRHSVLPFTEEEQLTHGGHGFNHKGNTYVHHSTLHHRETAFRRLSGLQKLFLLAIVAAVFFSLTVNYQIALIIGIAILTTLYFCDLLFNLFLIFKSFAKPAEIQISNEEINQISHWPIYTILCPLYKELKILPQFLKAMGELEYPKDRLQVLLLLEEDDVETIKYLKNISLPSYFEMVVVPHSKPKTKPKACNYGLKFAKGEYVVIYDAEDIPEPQQLKKVIVAFEKVDKDVICIQAKLNFYNPHQNIISKIFTAEYSLWFELILSGLQSIHAPIPLGGTSNHFRKTDLQHKLGGWDSFNVTEDCDLGMRLVKRGYRTAIVDSLTLEEANTKVKNWFGQRSRWIKGYMQTYLVHMRKPQEFLTNSKRPHILTFQLVVGGKILSTFINPLMWAITLGYFIFHAQVGALIEAFFPTPILYMGVISLILGNFLYLYYYMVGCLKHGHYDLVKYVFFVPFYWLAMSIASWIAVFKLIVAPHHWVKTHHGLHLDHTKPIHHEKIKNHSIVTAQVLPTSSSHESATKQLFVQRSTFLNK